MPKRMRREESDGLYGMSTRIPLRVKRRLLVRCHREKVRVSAFLAVTLREALRRAKARR